MKIGITGGSSLIVLGALEEVMSFFRRLSEVPLPHFKSANLITDRLYRRYMLSSQLAAGASDLAEAIAQMKFSATADERAFDERFLLAFQECAESAEVNYDAFRNTEGYRYEHVRIVRADLPWFELEKQRPLEEYDLLEGDPFWSRMT